MIIDIVVFIILGISVLIAFLRGFIRELLTIGGVVGGLAAAYYLGPFLLPMMDGWLGVDRSADEPQKIFDILPAEYFSQGLTWASIFLIVVVILSLSSHVLAETIKKIGLGAIDRTMGVIFGLVRGVLLVGFLYLPVQMTMNGPNQQEKVEEWFSGSQTHFYMEGVSAWIASFFPDSVKEDMVEKVNMGKEAMGGSAREALERMKVLKDGSMSLIENDEDLKKLNDELNGNQNGPGYNEDFRENMDQLFEQENREENEDRSAPNE